MWFSQSVTHGSDVRVKPTRIESLLGDRKSTHLVFSNSTSISVVLLNYMRNVKTEYSCRLKVRLHRTGCLSFPNHAFVWFLRVRFCTQKSIAANYSTHYTEKGQTTVVDLNVNTLQYALISSLWRPVLDTCYWGFQVQSNKYVCRSE